MNAHSDFSHAKEAQPVLVEFLNYLLKFRCLVKSPYVPGAHPQDCFRTVYINNRIKKTTQLYGRALFCNRTYSQTWMVLFMIFVIL